MTDQIAGLDQPLTAHHRLVSWVREIAALARPARVYWCDGSPGERDWLTGLLVRQGTFTPLNGRMCGGLVDSR